MPREAAWHHRARQRRAAARTLIQASKGRASKAVWQAAALLEQHHGSCAGRMGGWKGTGKSTRHWTRCEHCKTAKAWIFNDRIKADSICNRCGNLWAPQVGDWPDLKGNNKAPGEPRGFEDMVSAILACADAPADILEAARKHEQAKAKPAPTKKPDAMLAAALNTKAKLEGELNSISHDIRQNNIRYDKLIARLDEKAAQVDAAQCEIDQLKAAGAGGAPVPPQSVEEFLVVPDLSKYEGPDQESVQAIATTLEQMRQQLAQHHKEFNIKVQEATNLLASTSSHSGVHEDPRTELPGAKKAKGADGAPHTATGTIEAEGEAAARAPLPSDEGMEDVGPDKTAAPTAPKPAAQRVDIRSGETLAADIAESAKLKAKKAREAKQASGADASEARSSS